MSLPAYKGARKAVSLTFTSRLLEGQESGGGREKRKKKSKACYTKYFGTAKEWCKHCKQLKAKSSAFLLGGKKVMDLILHCFAICEDFDYL